MADNPDSHDHVLPKSSPPSDQIVSPLAIKWYRRLAIKWYRRLAIKTANLEVVAAYEVYSGISNFSEY